MKLQTPSNPDQFKPAKAVSLPETAAGSTQSNDKTAQPVQPNTAPTRKKAAQKPQRKAKPAALEPTYKINLNCTLERRDAINAAAAALGLTTTAYLLYCEEQSVHKLVRHFSDYIETVTKMNIEAFDERLKKIEQLLKTISSPY